MRIHSLVVAAILAAALGVITPRIEAQIAPGAAANDVIARLHFIGTKQLASDPNATNLDKIGVMPETAAMRDNFLDKLAVTPFRLFHDKVPDHSTNDYAPLIRPLLSDLLEVESYTEMRGPTNKVPELMLAVHLDDKEATLWQSNLSIVISHWTGIATTEISGEGYRGWELKKHHDPNVIRCLRAGDWLLFGWGWDELRLQPKFLEQIKKTKRPVESAKTNFLDAWIDWPSITPYHAINLPILSPYKLPQMHLSVQVEPKTRMVRPELVMQFPEPLKIKLSPWRFPTNTIHNPIVSFTAVRGVAPWLSTINFMKAEPAEEVPNQFCTWAMSAVPFETYLAVPHAESSNFLAGIAPHIVTAANEILTNRPLVTHASWTNAHVAILDIPFVRPDLQTIHEKAGDFVLGSLFATPTRKGVKPMPPELIKEINSKPNLVYYDWEMNRDRISQWQQLLQVYLLTSAKELPPADAAGQKWLTAVSTNLGNCGTEISLTTPNELTLIRNSPVGFTGVEMNLLTLWLDSPGFPLETSYPRKKGAKALPHP